MLDRQVLQRLKLKRDWTATTLAQSTRDVQIDSQREGRKRAVHVCVCGLPATPLREGELVHIARTVNNKCIQIGMADTPAGGAILRYDTNNNMELCATKEILVSSSASMFVGAALAWAAPRAPAGAPPLLNDCVMRGQVLCAGAGPPEGQLPRPQRPAAAKCCAPALA